MKRKLYTKPLTLPGEEGRCSICGFISDCECPMRSCDADAWYYGVPESGDNIED